MSEKTATATEEKKETQPESTDKASKKPVDMSPEELEEQKNAFMQKMYPGYQFKEPTKKDDPENPAGIPKTKETPEPEKKDEVETEPEDDQPKDESETKTKDESKPVKAEIPPPISEFKLPKDDPEDKTSTPPKLTKRDQRNVDILRKLEEIDPKYRGKAEEYVSYLSAAESYIGNWEKENPRKKFNAKDEEHQEFFAANYPEVDEDDLEDARMEYMKDQIIKDSQSKTKKEIDELKREQESGRREPEIAKVAERSVIEYLAQSDDNLAKHIKKDDNGAMFIDKEAMDAMEDEDALAATIITETAEPLRILVTELEKAAANPGKFEFNVGKAVRLKESGMSFYPHAELSNFMTDFELMMLKLPAEKTTFNGRRLVSSEDFVEMEQKIVKAKTSDKEKEKALRDLDSKYYFVTTDLMRAGLIAKYSRIAKSQIERLRKLGAKSTKEDPEKKAKQESGKSESTPTKARESKSPSLASNSDSIDTSKKSNNAGDFTTEKAVRRLWGG